MIQRRGLREGGRDDFFRDWPDYKWGFGDVQADHWIGKSILIIISFSLPSFVSHLNCLKIFINIRSIFSKDTYFYRAFEIEINCLLFIDPLLF